MIFKWTLHYVLWIEILNLFLLLEALKVGQKGVCTVTISVQKTRSKWVTINKRCGKKKCSVKKTEKYSAPQQQIICCSGWEYHSNDTCSPICQPGCQGGQCTAPNNCTCDPGSTPHPDQKNICLSPKCDPPCVNADCVSNKCLCRSGFQTYNSSHCSNCEPGFSTTKDLECVPICEGGCPNGKCTGPNDCTCDEGYENNEFDVCVPTCTHPCKNGKCSAPNICTCDEGYQKNGTGYCEPVCAQSCTNGKCTEPNVCICNAGFEKNATNVCVPKCADCKNGTCTAPDICTCNSGFTKNISGFCEPVCECVNSTCVAPNKCSCFEGYEKLNETVCVPKCDKCNGICVEPNVCKCAEGLENIDGECKSICGNCENGHCVGHSCVCNEGFVADRDLQRCVRDCTTSVKVNQTITNSIPKKVTKSKECPSGYKNCTAKEIKKLHDFDEKKYRCCYKTETKEKEIVVCCNGYEYLNEKCNPICNPACDHGKCIYPDVCQCDQLYTWHDKKCIPSVCNPPCGINTICSNDTCTCVGDTIPYNTTHCIKKCDPGYDINITSLVCEPHCESGCQNGKCVGPNTCECNDGYKLEDSSCIPVCEQCENGACVAPNNCQCNEGYQPISGFCRPICYSCTNGDCIAPNVCKCHEGYQSINGTCNPACANCANGDCIAPNVCQCHEGYQSINGTCNPACANCANGDCIAPNVCQCHAPGYTKHSNGSCIPVCTEECVNADCTDPNICTCHSGYEVANKDIFIECRTNCDSYTTITNEWICAVKCEAGYMRNVSDPNTCYKPCKGPCEFGICTRDGVCECRGGFELVNDTCSPLPSVDCSSCVHNCSNDACWCQDGRTCTSSPEVGAEVTSAGLASMELGWGLGVAMIVLLLVLVMAVMFHLYKRRRTDTKAAESDPYGSVAYTVPDTLLAQRCPNLEEAIEVTEVNENEAPEANAKRLLSDDGEP